jgi:L-ribulose-5-phosphate 3-epimerase
MPAAAKAAGFHMSGAMLGFPGEDYTTPQTIQRTGGFGPKQLRPERLDRFRWALDRVKQLGLTDLMLHAGFLPHEGDPERKPLLEVLAKVGDLAKAAGVIVAFETGQETADLLRKTLDDLKSASLKVNFDPANMLLYDMGDPLRAVEILGPDIRSVHVKDANRPAVNGQWGEEVPLGRGQVNIKEFVATLKRVGYRGPLCIEREVGDQTGRMRDIAHGIAVLRDCLA